MSEKTKKLANMKKDEIVAGIKKMENDNQVMSKRYSQFKKALALRCEGQ